MRSSPSIPCRTDCRRGRFDATIFDLLFWKKSPCQINVLVFLIIRNRYGFICPVMATVPQPRVETSLRTSVSPIASRRSARSITASTARYGERDECAAGLFDAGNSVSRARRRRGSCNGCLCRTRHGDDAREIRCRPRPPRWRRMRLSNGMLCPFCALQTKSRAKGCCVRLPERRRFRRSRP